MTQERTPMQMVFDYIDSMINDNIDWLELKQKALELEKKALESAEERGYQRRINETNNTNHKNY